MSESPERLTDGNGNLPKHSANEVTPEFDMPAIDSPFSFRKPKDVVSGLSSGLKNVLKGIGIGLAVCIAAPIIGAREEGVKGAAKGLGIGLITGILVPFFGAISGVVQVTRGVFNTPKAIKERFKGKKVWDKSDRKWIVYSLKEEAELVLNETEEQYVLRKLNKKKNKDSKAVPAPVKKKCTKNVKETEFYDLLGITPDASSSDIKKGYYKMARKLHPDKNQGNPNANENFQKVGAAYQVLSDPVLRKKYDVKGREAVEDSPMIDSSALYMMIFGSEKFETYVGELKLAMMMLAGEDAETEDDMMKMFGSKTLNYKQNKREVQCAVNLVELLEQYTKEKEEEFKIKATKEAKELATTALGGALIAILGQAYSQHARIFLGFSHSITSGVGLSELKRRSHVIGTQYNLVSSAISGYSSAKKQGLLSKLEETEEVDASKQMEGFLIMVDTLWRLSVIDVETTVGRICSKIFADQDVTYEKKKERAKALHILGKIFKENGTKAEDGLNEIKQKLRTDFQTAQGFTEEEPTETVEQPQSQTTDIPTQNTASVPENSIPAAAAPQSNPEQKSTA